ncbi:hypothetical protein F4825DRAFT_436610 [Nemania diffusa]|nr:hypothetical protein F4825DRAFT_436610 [Nemania diffusa]
MRELPDINAMADHFEAFASGIIAHLEKLTATVDDSKFRTNLNKLDEFTSNFDDIQQNMMRDLSQSLTESLTRVVEQIVARKYKNLENFIVRDDLEGSNQHNKKGRGLLREELMNSIAAREANSIIRAANEGREDLYPLHSVSSNEPIEDFPKNRTELENLGPSAISGFLFEVGDPFEGGTKDERRDRLWMLSGVTRPQNFLFVRRQSAQIL